MYRHTIQIPDEKQFPINDWKIIETDYDEQKLGQRETIFATGNGYIGMRGNYAEGRPVFQSGTFINGFYESWPIVYGEEAYGFAKTGQTMLNVPDTKVMRLYVDDEPFTMAAAHISEYRRELDMRSGILIRELVWDTPSGKQVRISSRRLVSLEHRHLAALSFEVTVLNADAQIVISSEIVESTDAAEDDDDPRKAKGFRGRVLLPVTRSADQCRIVQCLKTSHSGLMLSCGIDHTLATDNTCSTACSCDETSGQVVFSADAKKGTPVRIHKFISYHTARDTPPAELNALTGRTLDQALKNGFDAVLESQIKFLTDFWRRSDIQLIAAHPRAQQCIRFNLFQIIQAAARADGTGVCAKGLTGQAYEGHYFWDVDIYLMPFLTYTQPNIARNLLAFRYGMLDKARERARILNQKGALFPWRTINGEEASAYFAAGTAQYHINADIMYALKQYLTATGDEAFLDDMGAEMLAETARLWVDLGFFSTRDNKFHIHSVTGPDEYTAIVNNNLFTNLMARHNLLFAAKALRQMRDRNPDRYAVFAGKIGLGEQEPAAWEKAGENMYIPYDEELGIHPQDDTFLDKEVWDFEATPDDRYPLLLYYHPLVIYRYQVIKQADVVLALFLAGNEFSLEKKKRNFDYYDRLTTCDSSLSACIQSIVAAEIGYTDLALDYLKTAVLMDLSDVGGNVKDGVHIASMGGTWMTFVYGFAGMRDYDGALTFNPKMHPNWEQLKFPLTYQGQMLEVDIRRDTVIYLLTEGSGLTIKHKDRDIALSPGEPVTISLNE